MTSGSPRQRRREITRRIIVEAALEMLDERGVDGLSMRALAGRVNYSAPALYKYFASKEELIDAIREVGFQRIAGHIGEHAPPQGPLPQVLNNIGLAYLEFANTYPELYRVMFDTSSAAPDTIEEIKAEPGFGTVLRMIAAGVESGELKLPLGYNADTLGFHFWITTHGIVVLRHTILRDAGSGFDQLGRDILAAFVKGMTP